MCLPVLSETNVSTSISRPTSASQRRYVSASAWLHHVFPPCTQSQSLSSPVQARVSNRHHEDAARPKPALDIPQQRRLFGESQMNEREETGNCGETLIRERQGRQTRTAERRAGHKLAGTRDLHGREVDTGTAWHGANRRATGMLQPHARSKTDAPGSIRFLYEIEPLAIRAVLRVVGAIRVRHEVVSAPYDRLRITHGISAQARSAVIDQHAHAGLFAQRHQRCLHPEHARGHAVRPLDRHNPDPAVEQVDGPLERSVDP